MKSYQSLVSEINRLQSIAEKRRNKEVGAAIAGIRRTLVEYSITLEELAKALRRRTGVRKSKESARTKLKRKAHKVAPKYRDPESGTTWSGRGLAPKWLAEKERAGAKREQFLIAKPAAKKAAKGGR